MQRRVVSSWRGKSNAAMVEFVSFNLKAFKKTELHVRYARNIRITCAEMYQSDSVYKLNEILLLKYKSRSINPIDIFISKIYSATTIHVCDDRSAHAIPVQYNTGVHEQL